MPRLLALLPLLLAACAPVRLTPPPRVADPVTVTILDYGGSSRLLLPRGDGSFVEYGYGEWKWYALGRQARIRAFPVLLIPTRGTLGRREHPTDPTPTPTPTPPPTPPPAPASPTNPAAPDADLTAPPSPVDGPLARYENKHPALIPITVERAAKDALLARLDARFEAGRAELVRHDGRDMDFVPDPDAYWIFNQSTTTTRDWLRELGVDARGFALRSRFAVLPPEGRAGADPEPDSAPGG